MATRCSSRSCSASAPAVSTPVSSSLPYGRRGGKRVLYSSAEGASASLLCSHQFPWLRTSRVKAVSSISSQFHCVLNLSTEGGALGNSLAGSVPLAPGDLNQYRVTMPKLPPPPPVCAHPRSRLGSPGSRVPPPLPAGPSSSPPPTPTPSRG